jgi:hypothetical protein
VREAIARDGVDAQVSSIVRDRDQGGQKRST